MMVISKFLVDHLFKIFFKHMIFSSKLILQLIVESLAKAMPKAITYFLAMRCGREIIDLCPLF